MSIESLKSDLKANTATLATLSPLSSPAEIVEHLKNTLWPFLESIVDETAEVDECVADLLSGAEDILQPETAEVFAAIIAGAVAVGAALKARITREAEPQLYKVIEELETNCKSGEDLLREVVIDAGDEDDDDEGGEDDDDEDDEDADDEGDQP